MIGRRPRLVYVDSIEARRRAGALARRFHITLLLAAVIGVLTGLAVAGFDVAVSETLEFVLDQPLIVVALVPPLGLIGVNVLNRVCRDDDAATTDAYMRAYHERGGRLSLRQLWRKLIGSALTLGSGNAFGFEGPSILLGSTIGTNVEERFGSREGRDDAKVLMVAGAAAGVAAVFKAPLTGVVFALEVPYRADVARRALLPSLVAAGTSYVTFAALLGTEPLLATGGSAPFDLRDLGGGLLLGIVCGVLARLGAAAIGRAKRLQLSRTLRVALAAGALAALAPVGQWWFDGPFHLGPSYETIEWASHPDRTVAVLAGVFALRAIATWLGVAAGGIGGLFIPLVTQGAIVGALCQHILDAPNPLLFPTVGIAAFLGAGYRTPLAGVAFVAEATGQPGFLVPALLAAAASQLTMGRQSFSPYQRHERAADIGPLTTLAVADIMNPNADTVDVSLALGDALTVMLSQNRRWAPAVDGGAYAGLLAVTDIVGVPRDEWSSRTVGDVIRSDVLPASARETVASVSERLRAAGVRAVAVTDGDRVVGVVTQRDLDNVEVLLDHLANTAEG
ncbi:chloride channel protein [Desertimonas flava]|uniref:chloride channel protein n=1 Tax=Desertimonas flava TaxID=2064846 RepID=UPI0013C448F5|nr:chloride channel protein [Desertimonas flava]